MADLSLATARVIIDAAMAAGRKHGFKPLTVAVLDAGGATIALDRADGSSPLRPKIAHGKAHGCLMLGMGGRAIFARAEQQPFFIQSINALSEGALVPVPGGVLIRDGAGAAIGAVGITGDTSDNDEICAVAGVEAAGLKADTGA